MVCAVIYYAGASVKRPTLVSITPEQWRNGWYCRRSGCGLGEKGNAAVHHHETPKLRNLEPAKVRNNESTKPRKYETTKVLNNESTKQRKWEKTKERDNGKTKGRCEQRKGDAKQRDYETMRLRNKERGMRNSNTAELRDGRIHTL